MILILKTVYRCRYASATVDKRLAREGVDGHNWCVAKQSAKVHLVAHLLAYGRYDAYGCGFLVHHTDGCLVGYNAGYGCGRSVAMASSFSIVKAPASTASIMPWSSLTGMKAPLSPPT